LKPAFIPPKAVALKIVQDYLVSDVKKERRIRASELNGLKTFYYTEKEKTKTKGKRYEHEIIISYARYLELMDEKDQPYDTIRKTRYCFLFAGKKFDLDVYNMPTRLRGLVIMEVELVRMTDKIKFPPDFKLEEATGIDAYSNRSLARKQKK
jgi:CYTH domain-containing protein